MASERDSSNVNQFEHRQNLKSRTSVNDENNYSERWGFMEKNSAELNTTRSKDNIENHSPNTNRGFKRSHSKSEICDSKIFKCQELSSNNDFDSLFSSLCTSVHSLPSSNNLDNHINVGSSSQSNDCSSLKEKGVFVNYENGSIQEIFNSERFSGERKRFDDFKNLMHPQNSIASDIKLNATESRVHISPLPSCGPHPPFHQHTQSFMRHTTFDDDFKVDEKSHNVNHYEKIEFDLVRTDSKISKFDENVEIDSKIIENATESIEDTQDFIFEKECFVSNNLSFCDSFKDNCDSPRSECRNSNCSENAFSKLFDENVLSIFQWLPKQTLVRCMLVCKRWHRLALDSRLWSRVCLGGKVLQSGVIPSLMSRHPIVLRLANSQLVSPVIAYDVVPPVTWRVQFLDLSAASVAPSCLANILNLCPGLFRLSLEGLALSETASTALGNLRQLKVLNLALTTGLEKEGAKSISKLKKLEALNVAWTGFKLDEMQLLCKGLSSSIQRLNLSGFRKSLTNDMIADVVIRCPNLVELDLSDCVLLSEEFLHFLKKLKKLEHLAISRCYKLQTADIAFLNTLPSLQCVDIFGLATPQTMHSFQCLLPKIQINNFVHSGIARPTVGNRRTSIWGLRTRD